MASEALVSLLALIALAFVLYGPWQWVWTDFGRQFLFEERATLFDMAARGELSFASEEYKTIRRSLEKDIRFAHDLTWPYLLLVARKIASRGGHRVHKSKLKEAISRIENVDVRAQVAKLVFRAQATLILTVFLRSPVLWLGLPFYLIGAIGVHYWMRFRHAVKCLLLETGEMLQVEAERVVVFDRYSSKNGRWPFSNRR